MSPFDEESPVLPPAKATRLCFARLETSLGTLLVVGERAFARVSLKGIYFDGAPHSAGVIPRNAIEDPSAFTELHDQLSAYVQGRRTTFDFPLAPVGTAFQLDVWKALSEIPYGTTTTYAAVARAVGKPNAIRAVGSANGRNPLSIVVPCHRVIGKNGTLTGYAGGLARKMRLLEIESSRSLRIPQPGDAQAS